MPTTIICENEECTYCINGVCDRDAVKINYRGKCESIQVREPGGIYEQEKV